MLTAGSYFCAQESYLAMLRAGSYFYAQEVIPGYAQSLLLILCSESHTWPSSRLAPTSLLSHAWPCLGLTPTSVLRADASLCVQGHHCRVSFFCSKPELGCPKQEHRARCPRGVEAQAPCMALAWLGGSHGLGPRTENLDLVELHRTTVSSVHNPWPFWHRLFPAQMRSTTSPAWQGGHPCLWG